MALSPSLSQADATTAISWPIALPVLRVVLIALGALTTWVLLSLSGNPVGFSSITQYSALALAPINVLCLLLLARLLRCEGSSIRQLAGLDPARIGRDLAWAMLWLMVMCIPFAFAVMGTMFAMYGGEMFTSFERVFAPEVHAGTLLPQSVAVVLPLLTVLTFAPLNAPTEELVFHGYAQGRLNRAWPAALAVLLPAVVFGLQHALFAPIPRRGAGLHRRILRLGPRIRPHLPAPAQARPAPLCHLIVNLLTSLPASIVPFDVG